MVSLYRDAVLGVKGQIPAGIRHIIVMGYWTIWGLGLATSFSTAWKSQSIGAQNSLVFGSVRKS